MVAAQPLQGLLTVLRLEAEVGARHEVGVQSRGILLGVKLDQGSVYILQDYEEQMMLTILTINVLIS